MTINLFKARPGPLPVKECLVPHSCSPWASLASPAPDADVLCLLFGRRVAMVNTWQERGGGEPNHKGAVSQLLTGSEVEAFSSLTPHSEVLFP